MFVVEGITLLDEALDAGAAVESVYVATPAGGPAPEVARRAWEAGVRVFDLAPGVIERVADTVAPQPVLAVVAWSEADLSSLGGPGPVVLCVDVRDPGNLGTVLRSAEAAGAAGVVCCDGTVDVYNPKCVRASAGAVFHVPIVTGGAPHEHLVALGAAGRLRLGAAGGRGSAYTDAPLGGPVVLVLGNEANGLGAALDDDLDGFVHIPMDGRAESVNVGMACAVLCFEAARQRHAGGPAAAPVAVVGTAAVTRSSP